MQLRKPNSTRSAQASRGPAGPRAAGALGAAAEEEATRGAGPGLGSGVAAGVATGKAAVLGDAFALDELGALALRFGATTRAAEAARAAAEAGGIGVAIAMLGELVTLMDGAEGVLSATVELVLLVAEMVATLVVG